jgi:hypothetical protein
MKRLFITLLLLASPAFAQVPTQTKSFFGQSQTTYEIPLEPTVAGQAIILDLYAAGALWQPGTVCALANQAYNGPFCNYNLYDSQGNQFVQVNRDYTQVYYVPASKGGPETITVSYILGAPENVSAVAMVFPDTLVLQDVVPPRCDFRPQGTQKQICNPWNPWLSVNPTDDTAVLSSFMLVSSVPNELFIGHGQPGAARPVLTPTSGWSVPLWGGEVFLSYATVPTAGTQTTFTLAASPALGEGQYIYLGIQGFKVIPIQ